VQWENDRQRRLVCPSSDKDRRREQINQSAEHFNRAFVGDLIFKGRLLGSVTESADACICFVLYTHRPQISRGFHFLCIYSSSQNKD